MSRTFSARRRAPGDLVATEGLEGRAELQRRTIRVLFVSVLPAGAALSATMSSAALLGKDITGSGVLGTLAAAVLTLGTALATVPISRLMARSGRRAGLRCAWTIATAGALCTFAAAVTSFYPLLLIGAFAIGVGNTGTLSARYAAADLAADADRARAIGMLVWAGSFGSVLGPTIGLGWAGTVARWIGLPKLAGPYLMGAALFALSAWWIERTLRPDPLEVAGGIEPPHDGTEPPLSTATALIAHFRSTGRTVWVIARNAPARLAVVAMLTGHAVMVAVMTATPLHMKDGEHELQVIGFVISLHIVGMYFFAPVVGMLVDRFGSSLTIAVGGMVLFAGSELASHTDTEDSMGVFVGLFLVGLGWSFGLVAGSALLTASFPIHQRVVVQGAADLVMSVGGAAAALSAGFVFELASFRALSHYAGFAAIALSCLAIWGLATARRGLPRST